MELTIHVDRRRCIGSGQCVHWAPGVFTQDDEAISVVVDPRGEPAEKIVTAVVGCPVEAISLRIDGVGLDTRHLADWRGGALLEDPLVSLLAELGDDHDELRDALGAVGGSPDAHHRLADGPPDRGSPISELIESWLDHHLVEERAAYPAMADLVGRPLIDAFGRDHAGIERAVGRLRESAPDEVGPGQVVELARLLAEHIRLEETLLFPLALGVLAGKASGRAEFRMVADGAPAGTGSKALSAAPAQVVVTDAPPPRLDPASEGADGRER